MKGLSTLMLRDANKYGVNTGLLIRRSRVRIPAGVPDIICMVGVAQLVRVPGCGPGG